MRFAAQRGHEIWAVDDVSYDHADQLAREAKKWRATVLPALSFWILLVH